MFIAPTAQFRQRASASLESSVKRSASLEEIAGLATRELLIRSPSESDKIRVCAIYSATEAQVVGRVALRA